MYVLNLRTFINIYTLLYLSVYLCVHCSVNAQISGSQIADAITANCISLLGNTNDSACVKAAVETLRRLQRLLSSVCNVSIFRALLPIALSQRFLLSISRSFLVAAVSTLFTCSSNCKDLGACLCSFCSILLAFRLVPSKNR